MRDSSITIARRDDGAILRCPDGHSTLEVIESVRRARLKAQRDLLAKHLPRAAPTRHGEHNVTWIGDVQQGDGGKGAVTDRLARFYSVVARVQGGDNCGHTSVYRDARGRIRTIYSHIIPSGARHRGTYAVIGNGVMLNPEQMRKEVEVLEQHCPDVRERLLVSTRSHLVFPFHRKADALAEAARTRSSQPVGTTLRGIGPANVSKVARIGIRVGDLVDMSYVECKLAENIAFFGLSEADYERDLRWIAGHREFLLDHAVETREMFNAAVERGYSMLFEGGQGPLIDLEHGTYPFVTTCPTTVHSMSYGTGLPDSSLTFRLGVLKAYHTMVGNGPFVTEDHADTGRYLRKAGKEYGTTTERPRRCGWLDLVSARWGASINEYDALVVTKLDILDALPEIKVCVAYAHGGELVEYRPDSRFLDQCTPIYKTFEGWQRPSSGLSSIDDLPKQARSFLDFIESYLGVEIAAVTTGPCEEDILFPNDIRPEFEQLREGLRRARRRGQVHAAGARVDGSRRTTPVLASDGRAGGQ
ncbi:adenylosuccinate synthase [Piscinibacter sp. XHJ-5]|uniref:adenylosuccinate synthase n=1 Tax=Piscinibacter sp. XHJ-5 TaxID=3037797 RepID=UPI0024529E71|nr:adenylosuccinate synthase [Piscinibacter sp. XHJ-5]